MLEFDYKRFLLGGVEVPEQRDELVRMAQLRAYIEMIPAAALGMVLVSLALALLNWGRPLWPVYFAFWYALAVFAFQLSRMWLQHQRDPDSIYQLDPARMLHRISLQSGVSGAVWGMLVAFLVWDHSVFNLALTSGLAVGLLCLGAFLLAVAPRAALLHMAGVSGGFFGALMLSGDPLFMWAAPLIVGLIVVLQRFTNWQYANFVEQVIARQEIEESSEVISLLLHDFETHSSDWLWEVDRDGRLNRVSTRFADALKRPREILEGAVFHDFFEGEQAERLAELMTHGRAFRDHVAPVRVNGALHWWSISAKPRLENDAVIGYRGVCSDVTQARETEARIAHMAHFDALTGLANRAFFASELEAAVERLQNTGEGFALHCIDLDDFKGVNDVHGHPAGDELLKTVARRIKQCVNDNDLIGRQGGDEFIVLQRDVASRDDAVFLADIICDALLAPVQLKSRRLLATGSVGSVVAPDDGEDASTLLKHADLALYAAKKCGRGCMRFFQPHMDEEARRRSQIEQELRAALRSNELELHFQPLIDVQTMQTKGYESLLRWRRPNGEMVMPGEFIEIAENTGLIIPLGEWVIRTAIAEAQSWTDDLTVAINLSPIQMSNPSLISTVVTALASTGLDPARVEFEITETVLLEETELNLKTLHALRDLRVKIALDDFGTGFSSLNYLRAFPFDKIKIDKCFVQEMEHREDCRAIIRAVMTLAHSLHMRTTAEGVENERQMEMLREEGCSEFQGFLFSTPIPASQLPRKGQRANDDAARAILHDAVAMLRRPSRDAEMEAETEHGAQSCQLDVFSSRT